MARARKSFKVGELVEIVENYPRLHYHPIGSIGVITRKDNAVYTVQVGRVDQLISSADMKPADMSRIKSADITYSHTRRTTMNKMKCAFCGCNIGHAKVCPCCGTVRKVEKTKIFSSSKYTTPKVGKK